MSTQRDPHAVSQASKAGDAPQHTPRMPGARADEADGRDHPNKPFRTPNKNRSHPAPERATDGEPETKKH
jgi:hypothetical protein